MLDIGMFVCGFFFAVGGLWISYLGVFGHLKSQRVLGLSVVFGSLFFLLLGGYFYFLKQAGVSETATAPEPFSVTIGGQWGQGERNLLGSWFWLSYNWKGRATLSPIHRLIFIRITNRQPVKSMIETYSVEAQTAKGDWVKLVWMDGQMGLVYWLSGDIRKAMLVTVPKLDSVLSNRALNPNETVDGWAFFEIPEDIALERPLRIYVKDLGGAEITETIENVPGNSFTQGGASVKTERTLDLSDDNPTVWYYSKVMSGAAP